MAANGPCAAAQNFLATNGIALASVLETTKLLDDERVQNGILTEEESEDVKSKDNDLAKAVELIQIVNAKDPEQILQFVQVVKERGDVFKSARATTRLLDTLDTLHLGKPPQRQAVHMVQPAAQSHTGRTCTGAQSASAARKTTKQPSQSKLLTRMMQKVADSFAKNYDCKKLAVELEVEKKIVDRLVEQYRNPNEVALELLGEWKSFHSTAATPDWLLEAVENIGKKDLADEVKKEFLEDLQPPAPAAPARRTIWDEIYKRRRQDLEKKLGTADDIAVGCWSEGLLTDQEKDHLAKESDRHTHNVYLLDRLGILSASQFPVFVSVLEKILDGGRYGELVELLKEDYRIITGKPFEYHS